MQHSWGSIISLKSLFLPQGFVPESVKQPRTKKQGVLSHGSCATGGLFIPVPHLAASSLPSTIIRASCSHRNSTDPHHSAGPHLAALICLARQLLTHTNQEPGGDGGISAFWLCCLGPPITPGPRLWDDVCARVFCWKGTEG